MKAEKCPVCGPPMKRDGKTGAGTQRWRCGSCGASPVHRYGSEAKEPGAFPGWLLSKGGQASMPGGRRAFRRRAEKFWRIWPMPEVADGVHRVVYVDGIYVAGDLAAPIACGDSHVLSWYMAKAETTRARRAAVEDRAARGRGGRWRRRVRVRGRRGMAGDQGPKMPVPCVLPGQEAYHVPSEAAGGDRALRAGEGADAP